MTLTITPAELRSEMESYGFGVSSLAEVLNVRDSSVTNWYGGRTPIPPGVLQETHTIVSKSNHLVADLTTRFAHEASPTMTVYDTSPQLWAAHPEYIPLPASWYRVIAARVKAQVPHLRIVYDS